MPYEGTLKHTSSGPKTSRFTVAVNAPLIRPNALAVQLAVPNDPRSTRFVTNLRIEPARKGCCAVIVPKVNTRCETVYRKQWLLITSAHHVRAVCRSKTKAVIRRSPRSLHMNTNCITAQIESRVVAEDEMILLLQSNPVV
ncbi:hypothetical protein TNCV_2220591 [Trichonephila clavipes]|nr:hypothetical protein TNCV_2220591 [Trichonephila clavipes]